MYVKLLLTSTVVRAPHCEKQQGCITCYNKQTQEMHYGSYSRLVYFLQPDTTDQVGEQFGVTG